MKQKKNWAPLFFSNFLGVFNDNLLKNLICFISIYWVAKGNESIIIMMATGFMVLPYILFSPFAGFLAKTLIKRKIIVYAKFAEIPIMALAFAGFLLSNIYVVMVGMFLMGLQSTMFSPAKFGLIRDIGGEEGISFGTGFIEMLTFLGVLLGTFIAGFLSDLEKNRLLWIGLTMLMISGFGYLSGLFIKANESKPLKKNIKPLNPFGFLIRMFKWSRRNAEGLNYVVFGLSNFWLIGSLIQMNMLVYCPKMLHMSNTQTGIVMALVAVSIGLGCWLSGVVARRKVEVGLIPFGGVGLTLFVAAIFIFQPGNIGFTILIMLAAFSSGFFKIPLNAWMQSNVRGRKLGDAVAYNNLMNFIFILFSALIFGAIESNFGSRVVFLVISVHAGLLTLLMTTKLKGVSESIKRLTGR